MQEELRGCVWQEKLQPRRQREIQLSGVRVRAPSGKTLLRRIAAAPLPRANVPPYLRLRESLPPRIKLEHGEALELSGADKSWRGLAELTRKSVAAWISGVRG